MIVDEGGVQVNSHTEIETKQSLRNRKHVPCFYRVTEVWENEKCSGNTTHRPLMVVF